MGRQVAGETITRNHGDAVSGVMQKKINKKVVIQFLLCSFQGRYPVAHLGGGKTRLPAESLSFLSPVSVKAFFVSRTE
jgi:hypothetical protein